MSLDEVLERVHALSGNSAPDVNGLEFQTSQAPELSLVELTGGEPLLQPEAIALAERLTAEHYTVLVETSGERFVGLLPREVVKIVDVKCPDSGESGRFAMDNLEVVDGKDEIKFVIGSRRDYEFAKDFSIRHELPRRVRQVLFSPVFPDPNGSWKGLEARLLAEWMLADGLPVRLSLQLHKFIWHPSERGV
jgi:7-carboxy-7-deazaguanine synthase